MAERAQPVNGWRRPGGISLLGLAVAVGLLMLALAAIGALMSVAGNGSGMAATGYIRHVTLFTFGQAAASAVLALILALLTARVCWRRAEEWRTGLILAASFLPVVMPTTVAATGIIGVWGQRGMISGLLQTFGMPPLPPVYGLGAVLLAHVFFNAPLMLRVLSGALAGVSPAQWRMAAQYGLSGWQRFLFVEWPAMRRVIPGLLALVFLLCFTSFSLILMLGGGPSVTTLEVSIYTALRFDFDMALAGRLALLQLAVCGCVVVLLTLVTGRSWGAAASTMRPIRQQGEGRPMARLLDALILLAFLLVAAAPVIAVVWRGIGPHLLAVLSWPSFWRATLTSLAIAVMSGVIATMVALLLAAARTRRQSAGLHVWPLDLAISLYLAVSAIVLGTGLFILLRQVADVFFLAPGLVLLGNILVALPFAYRVLEGRLSTLAVSHDRLCASLGLRGWRRFRVITLPAITSDLGFAAGLSSALSLGDMTIIALFGSQQFQTLPWLLYQTMARYRSGEAAALALWLLVLTLVIFVLFTLASGRIGRHRHA